MNKVFQRDLEYMHSHGRKLWKNYKEAAVLSIKGWKLLEERRQLFQELEDGFVIVGENYSREKKIKS